MGILNFGCSQTWVVKIQVEENEPYTRVVRGSKKSMISAAREKATEVVFNDTADGFIINCIVKGKKVTMEHSRR